VGGVLFQVLSRRICKRRKEKEGGWWGPVVKTGEQNEGRNEQTPHLSSELEHGECLFGHVKWLENPT